jgi:CHAD domain
LRHRTPANGWPIWPAMMSCAQSSQRQSREQSLRIHPLRSRRPLTRARSVLPRATPSRRSAKSSSSSRMAIHEYSSTWRWMGPIALDPAISVEAALERVGRRCLMHLLCNEQASLAGEPEGIHQMRVAIRRLRAALLALKRMLPMKHYRWASEELRWTAHALGVVRNWDIFVACLVRPVADALPARASKASSAPRSASGARLSTKLNRPSFPNDTPNRHCDCCDGLQLVGGMISRYPNMRLFF